MAETPSLGSSSVVTVEPPPVNEESAMPSLEQRVADAQVIVVATAFDSGPAAPKRPGDAPEFLIRFRVSQVLKGTLADNVITTRTPTAVDEFIGMQWVIFLSPNYMAGKYQYAELNWIKAEPDVTAILAKAKN